MKLRLFLIFFIVNVAFTGCISMRPSTERLTSDDCLVIIKTKLEKPNELKAAREYSIFINSESFGYKIPRKEEGYIALKVREKDCYIERIISNVNEENYEGNLSSEDIEIMLPYKHNSAIVADFIIVYSIRKISETESESQIYFDNIAEAEADELLNMVLEKKKYKSWN